ADGRPTLDELRRRRYRLAILTNNPPASQAQKIAACGFQSQFDEIVYAADLNAEKPAKEGFRYLAKRLKLSPAALVMVGDNLYSYVTGAFAAFYQYAFFLTRKVGFFNFHLAIFYQLSGGEDRFTQINSLPDLLRYLKP